MGGRDYRLSQATALPRDPDVARSEQRKAGCVSHHRRGESTYSTGEWRALSPLLKYQWS